MRFINYAMLVFLYTCIGCSPNKQKPEVLAKKYCASCHAFPEPSSLDKLTWEKNVLPEMEFRMGLNTNTLWQVTEDELAEIVKVIPKRPMVTDEDWQAIKSYYLSEAPDHLEKRIPLKAEPLSQFKVSQYSLPSRYPCVTHISFDSITSSFLVATRLSMLYKLDDQFKVNSEIPVASPISFIDRAATPWVMTAMGIMDPNDQKRGQLHSFSGNTMQSSLMIDSLRRPVHVSSSDFNGDQRTDYLVSEFGNYSGRLTIYEKNIEGFVPHVIAYSPGTRRAIITDFDKDGVNDILALTTQGDERIILYRGHNDFNFTPETLLRFSPVYGSSYFEFTDMNRDGYDDILYTNGDNADYSQILKPYHGIRIFLNDKKGKFTEATFLPMHGASMAMAKDFDHDGDVDIAAISFFPDFEKSPAEGFLYFENRNGKYQAFKTPAASHGRWLTMETADVDRDGDEEIILGSMNFTPGVPDTLVNYWQQHNTSLLVLENKAK